MKTLHVIEIANKSTNNFLIFIKSTAEDIARNYSFTIFFSVPPNVNLMLPSRLKWFEKISSVWRKFTETFFDCPCSQIKKAKNFCRIEIASSGPFTRKQMEIRESSPDRKSDYWIITIVIVIYL